MFNKILNLFKKENINQAKEVNSNGTLENINNNESLVEGISSFDNKTLVSCPKCGGNVIEVGDAWGCVRFITGECNFAIRNTNDKGEKLDISIIHALNKHRKIKEEREREARMYAELEAIVESCKYHKEITNKNNNSTESVNPVNETVTENILETQTVDKTTYVENENKTEDKANTEPKDSAKDDTKAETTNTTQESQTTEKTSNNHKQETNTSNNKSYSNQKRKLDAKCSCGSDIYRFGNMIKCSNTTCGFEMSTKCLNKNFSDYHISKLLERRVSSVLTLTSSKSGKEFNARVFIDFDKNLKFIPKYKFIFDSDFSTLSEHHKANLFRPDTKERQNVPLQDLIDELASKLKNKTKNNQSNGNSQRNKEADFDFNDYNNFVNQKINTQNVNTDNIVDIEKFNAEAESF